MAANQGANILRDAVSRIPHWQGDGKDSYTASQWLARVEKARVTANWQPAEIMSFVYVSLRGEALEWWDCLTRSGVDINDFDQFKVAFMTSYETTRTARTAIVVLQDIRQGDTEKIVTFYTRTVKAIDDLEALLPGAARTPAAAGYPAEALAIPEFAALGRPIRENGLRLNINLGITIFANHIALQVFVAGLRPSIRNELMKRMPDTLWNAFQQALAFERIHATPKTTTTSVQEIESFEEAESVDQEIAAVNLKMKNLQFRKTQFANKQQGRSWSQNGKQSSSSESGSYANMKDVVCFHCKKKGHYIKDCRKRIAEGKPITNAQGKPIKSQGKVADISEGGATGGEGETTGQPKSSSSQGYWTSSAPSFQ